MRSNSRSCNVRVGVRIRPLTSTEIQQGGENRLSVASPSIRIGERQFTFDSVFDSNVCQVDLYHDVSPPLLKSFANGYNATIMAYGQTGSGKTFTMGSEAHTEPETPSHVGLIPRFISDFFLEMHKKKENPFSGEKGSQTLLDYNVSASFLEVYGEDVFDLLDPNRKSLPLREDSNGGIVISGLKSRHISNLKEALQVLHEGTMNRTTAATLMNLTSSRSHAVFTIYLSQRMGSDQTNQVDIYSNSKFTFVDLAGSERMKKTGAEGERAREGIKINEGLLALGNVINALADEERITSSKKVHVPYRQSKLTRLLQDALGGNSQTLFLACVSPSDTNASETLSTLHYANRARNIRNAPTKNVDPTSLELQRLGALAQVLQCELVKAKFHEGAGSPKRIGHIDGNIMQRDDVVMYMKSVHNAVNARCGESGEIDSNHCNPVVQPGTRSLKRIQQVTPQTDDSPVGTHGARNEKSGLKGPDLQLDEVNPDGDLAILDRLLELQSHDQQYDKDQEANEDQIKRLTGDLKNEEALLLQLRQSITMYQDLKNRYEELMGEVQQLETEKADLAGRLEKTKTDPSAGCSAALQRQLEKVELSLSRARRDTLSHRQKYKDAEEQAKKCRVLERRVKELKHAKSTLVRKQKDAAARYKAVTEAKTKELLALKRKEKNSEMRMSKLQSEIELHKHTLEKRKNYCTRLTQKMKQTEGRLLKFLAMRQRELVERANVVGQSGMQPLPESREKNRNDFTISIEEQKHFDFIFDKWVTEKIRRRQLQSQLDRNTSAYNDTMRAVIPKVKELNQVRKEWGIHATEESRQSVLDLEQTVADLELKLEIIGSEMEQIQSKLPDNLDFFSEGEKASENLLHKLSPQTLRICLRESLSKLVQSEITSGTRNESIIRKDAALISFESEVERLNKRVGSLEDDLRKRQVCSRAHGTPCAPTRISGSHCKDTGEITFHVSNEFTLMTREVEDLKRQLRLSEQELTESKGKLALEQGATENQMSTDESAAALKEMHKIWYQLGVDTSLRERTHKDIQYSVQRTCASKLKETILLRANTEREVNELSEQLTAMRKALGVPLASGSNLDGKPLLEKSKWLNEQVEKLQMPYKLACTRHKKIVGAASRLSKALTLSIAELPENLRDLLEKSNGFDSSSLIIGRKRRASVMKDVKMMVDALSSFQEHEKEGQNSQSTLSPSRLSAQSEMADEIPSGILDDALLERCEAEISSLRVKKSELLVQDREMQQGIYRFLQDMNMSTSEMVNVVELGLRTSEKAAPEWWNTHDAEVVLKRAPTGTGHEAEPGQGSRYIRVIFEESRRIGDRRLSVSTTLRANVERAQDALLNIVGRELDVNEAYASFHQALVKIPPLSMDLVLACVSEIEALLLGVDSMSQSEIEALTVVWEALNVSAEKRREFWGQVEELSMPLGNDNSTRLFDDFLLVGDEEDWIGEVVHRVRGYCDDLDRKLKKLRGIHEEVERLRSKQDKKSQILTLDSEIRILNSKFTDFEETKCSKQRLLTKKSNGSGLLKEERFRKQMQSKFVVKLGQLSTLLRAWEEEEEGPFEASLLSDDVRMLLQEPRNMEKWVEQRTKFMPLRTVQTNTPGRKRPLKGGHDATSYVGIALENPIAYRDATPKKKRTIRATVQERVKPNDDGFGFAEVRDIRTVPSKRKEASHGGPLSKGKNAQHNQIGPSSNLDERAPKAPPHPPKRQKRKESSTIPPFGNILSEGRSPGR